MWRGSRQRSDARLFIHLTRENKLDQAISHLRAEQSGLWHRAADGSELERVTEHRDPTYDADAIAAHMEAAERMDRAWEAWFEAETIAPLRVTYDVLSADPFATRDRILKALGVICDDAEEQTPPTAKLADAMNLAWAERFPPRPAGLTASGPPKNDEGPPVEGDPVDFPPG